MVYKRRKLRFHSARREGELKVLTGEKTPQHEPWRSSLFIK
ncbi:hypothetical protein [Alkalicoccus saliphilus]|nr:hypothetical protein [Alkalicoccus saliphilus]